MICQFQKENLIPESVGTTVDWREHNGYNDSDWFATYYDKKAREFKEVMFSTTRAGTSHICEVDATPAIKRYYVQLKKERAHMRMRRQAEIEEATPRVGKRVLVVRGRKVPKGTTGYVKRICRSFYGRDNFNALIENANDSYWVNVDYLKVIQEVK